MTVSAVVAAYEQQVAHHGTAVAQQVYAGVAIELLRQRLTRVVLMVAQTGIDRGLYAAELSSHVLVYERTYAHVYYVAGNEHHVGPLSVDHVHPAGQLLAGVVVAQVQVAHHDQPQRFGQRLRGGEQQRLAHLVVVADVSQEEHHEKPCGESCRGVEIVAQPLLRHYMKQAPKVEHQEDEREVEQYEDAGVAHVVGQAGQRHRQLVYSAAEVGKQQQERSHPHPNDAHAPHTRQRHQGPHMPAYIDDGKDGEQEENEHPHIFHCAYCAVRDRFTSPFDAKFLQR